jgi:hypothetical protein
MSEALAHSAAASHPVGLTVDDDLRRSRLTVFFRPLLAIPHFVVVALWSIPAVLAVLAAWFAGLVTGRVPDGLHAFIASFLRYSTRVNAYTLLLADPYPPFSSKGSYPIDVRIDGPQPQSRPAVAFRIVLAIPALFLTNVFHSVNSVIALLGWFYALATGGMHEGMRNLSAWLLRYEVQTAAYVMLLTGTYPSLAGAPSV